MSVCVKYVRRQLMTEHIEIKNTLAIQLASIDSFLGVIGYWKGFDNKFCTEYSLGVAHGFRGAEILSMNTVVKLHNSLWCKSVVDGYYFPAAYPEVVGLDGALVRQSPFMLDGYTLNKALAARIAEKAFIQRNKHGVVTCHKHLLKLADDSYYYLFIGE
jgi:hypothetical protein